MITAAVVLSGCKEPVEVRRDSGLKPFGEPVTITWNGDRAEGVQSFQADVHVYSMNNRTDTYASLTNSYSLAVRTLSDRILTRIDMDLGSSVPFRSVISDGEETVVFNPVNEEIGYRISPEESKSPLYRIFGNMNSLSRINLSLVREESRRLALNITEDQEGGRLMLELPPAMLPQNGSDKITRSRVAFNIADGTILESEVIMYREDGTTVTTKVTPVYEDKNGVPVKIGTVTEIHTKDPHLIEGIDPDTPVYNTPIDIPTLSESEFAAMQKEGNIHEVSDMTFGNPADLSNIETVFEVYQNIEINAVPESLFRLIMK